MRKFADNDGREWIVKVTTNTIEKIREIDIDLGDFTGQVMKRLAINDVLFVRVMWLICEQQADKEGITPAAFGESIFGDVLDTAYESLRGAMEDFFPSRKREYFRQMMKADEGVQAEALTIGLAAINDPANREAMTEAMRGRIAAEMTKALTSLKSATGSPDLSE